MRDVQVAVAGDPEVARGEALGRDSRDLRARTVGEAVTELEMAEEMVRAGDELVDLARRMRDEAVELRDKLLDEKYPDTAPDIFEAMGLDRIPAFPSVLR